MHPRTMSSFERGHLHRWDRNLGRPEKQRVHREQPNSAVPTPPGASSLLCLRASRCRLVKTWVSQCHWQAAQAFRSAEIQALGELPIEVKNHESDENKKQFLEA